MYIVCDLKKKNEKTLLYWYLGITFLEECHFSLLELLIINYVNGIFWLHESCLTVGFFGCLWEYHHLTHKARLGPMLALQYGLWVLLQMSRIYILQFLSSIVFCSCIVIFFLWLANLSSLFCYSILRSGNGTCLSRSDFVHVWIKI